MLSLAKLPILGPLFARARGLPPEPKRFIKFLFVGAFGFIVDFGGFNLFHALGVGAWVMAHLVPAWGIALTGQHPEVYEQMLSFSVAVLSNFLWNYLWIYPEARQANQAKKISKFIIVSVAGLILGVPVFNLALRLAQSAVAAAHLENIGFNLAGNLALMGRVGTLLLWNFFVNRYWTYRDVS